MKTLKQAFLVTALFMASLGNLWAYAEPEPEINVYCPAPDALRRAADGYLEGTTTGGHAFFIRSIHPVGDGYRVGAFSSVSVYDHQDHYMFICDYQDPEGNSHRLEGAYHPPYRQCEAAAGRTHMVCQAPEN